MDELREPVDRVLAFIREGWESTVRRAGHDAHPRLYLPYEFTVPCASDRFQELYYWDTYFTHLGLLRHGLVDLARSNVRNMFYLVHRYGFVPNSNAVYHLNRSQPPYLCMMVRDIYEATGDRDWLREACDSLEVEYRFWMTERLTDVGLNRHLHSATDHDLCEFYRSTLVRRLAMEQTDDATMRAVAYHYVAEAETGHDFTPRFDGRCADHVPVDLNSNLYEYEHSIADFRTILGRDGRDWHDRCSKRLTRMRRYNWSAAAGCFTDYDMTHDRTSGVTSAASFWPLAYGLATEAEARSTVRLLARLEHPHGVSTCADGADARRYQWGYPNAWPPVQYMVWRGLMRYGYHHDARRIARKYVETVTNRFESTGQLWEKYDATTGLAGGTEYEPARMLGWTAGVFVSFAEYLGQDGS